MPAPAPGPLQQLVAARRARAVELERDGRLRQALDEWRIALTLDPADPLAREGRDRLQTRVNELVGQRLRQGQEALGRGDHLEARRQFLAVLALDPAHARAFTALQREVKEIRFVSHTVKAGETLAGLADRYYGDRARAEVIWETNQLPPNPRLTAGSVLRIPEIPGVPFVLPELRPRPPAEAPAPEPTRPAEPARPPEPREPAEYHPLLLQAREALDRGDFQAALADVDRVLATQPQQAEGVELKKASLYGLGKAQLAQNRYGDSVQTLTQLTRLAPGFQDTPALLQQARDRAVQQHYARGLQLYREEKLEEAIAQWRLVLEYDPQHANARRNLDQAERLLKNLQQRQQPKRP